MKQILLLSVIALPLMLVLDFIWIGFIANTFYHAAYGPLYTLHPVWQAAALFYIIYILGLVYFVIAPAIRLRSLARAIVTGAFFALVAFGTYDLTSLAVITGWPTILSIVDIGWGVVEGAIVSALTYQIVAKFFKL